MLDSRRTFLKRTGGMALGAAAFPKLDLSRADEIRTASEKLGNIPPEAAARDEDFWYHIQKAYRLSPKFINLESGYFSPQTYSGVEALCKNTQMINEIPSFYMRRMQGKERREVTQLLAGFAGCSPEEILITRNTTESLNNVIMGMELKKGDEALWGSFEYPSMKEAFIQRAARDGIVNKIIEIPLISTSNEDIIKKYRKSITAKTKVILVSHMTYLSGQILPVREICNMAHEMGVEVIVDAAHSWTHIDYRIPDLDCDYYGASMHKWMGSPLGTGILYIRRNKIKNIWPLFGDMNYDSDNINKLGHIGTRPCAIELTIADAIKFNNSIGIDRKEARLRYLKDYWAEKVSEFPGVIMNTPMDKERSCGLANAGIKDISPSELVNYLYNKHKIFTVAINAPDIKGARIAPNIYTTLKELDVFIDAMREFCYS